MGTTNYGFDDILIVKENGHIYEVPFKKDIFKNKGKTVYAIRREFDGAKVSED